jgi:hypothetical protein
MENTENEIAAGNNKRAPGKWSLVFKANSTERIVDDNKNNENITSPTIKYKSGEFDISFLKALCVLRHIYNILSPGTLIGTFSLTLQNYAVVDLVRKILGWRIVSSAINVSV